jgi:DNA repair exonuclease SbcCD nuclease subunit
VTIFDSSCTSVPLRREGNHFATIHGASHPAGNTMQRLRDGFGQTVSPGLHIGLLHGAIGSDGPSDLGAQLSLEELCALPVRYWALGHHHARRTLREDPWVVYPGTPQARCATMDAGACGAMLVQVVNDEVRQVSFEPLDVVRCRSLVIEDAGLLQRTEVLRQALDRGRRLRRENDGRALLLNVRLRGRSRSLDDLSAWLVSELRTRTEEWSPFVWWTAGNDSAEREPSRALGADHGELGPLLLDRSRALLGAALPRSGFLGRELAPLRRVWDAELDLEEAKGLLKEATFLALEELSEGPPA